MIANLDPLYIKTRPAKAISRVISHSLFQGRPVTTKWRWLNPILIAMLKLAKQMPQLRPVEKPVFILGTGRSGTTILGKVLSMHRDVGFLNEPKLLWHVVYPEEDLIGSYAQGQAHYRLGADQASENVCRAIHHLYGFYLALTGSKRVLDKYPAMVFRASFLQAIFGDVKLLFLVRNGWDTVHSIELWSKRNRVQKNGEVHDWWGVNNRKWRLLVEQVIASSPVFAEVSDEVMHLSRHADMAAVEWMATMHEGLRLASEMPQQTLLVRFEDLTTRPQEILSQITEFCELPPDETFLAYARSILKPVPSRESVSLHPSIQRLFEETMLSLKYRP